MGTTIRYVRSHVRPGGAGRTDDRGGHPGAIARKNRFTRARLSGNEPTLARQHLLAVLRGLPEAFELQLKALEHLVGAGVSCHAAVMVSFSSPADLASLRRTLASIDPGLADFEAEEAFLNPGIEARLARCTDE